MNQNWFLSEQEAKLFYEKSAVKKAANHIGLGLILFYVVSTAMQVLILLFFGNKAATLLKDAGMIMVLNIALTLVGFLVAAFFILGLEKRKAASLLSYSRPKKGLLLPAIMVGMGFCYVANVAVSLLQGVLSGIMPLKGNDIVLPDGTLGFILSILSVAVFPALLEEFLFRGVIMGSLLKFGKGFALFTSTFIFGLVHGNLVQIPFAFLVGLVLGFVVLETGSFWSGVIIHFLNNLISLLLQYFEKSADKNIVTAVYMIFIAVMIMLGFFGIYLFSLKNKDLMKYQGTEHTSSAVQKFKWFCGSACIIIYLVIVTLEVLMIQLTGTLSA